MANETQKPTPASGERPKRIQRKRTKGWKMPPNAISVTRPGKFGNPFRIGGFYKFGDPDPNYRGAFRMLFSETNQPREFALRAGFTEITSAQMAVDWYRKLKTEVSPFSEQEIKALRGKDLACFCPLDEPCHADVQLEIVNAGRNF
jgi:hypothetical protein